MIPLHARIDDYCRAWRVVVDRTIETERAVLAFGQRDGQAVVLKVIKRPGDEWRSGLVLDAFGGKGVVRALEHDAGAVLLERLEPGRSLADVAAVDDDQATKILADVIGRMSPNAAPDRTPTVESLGEDFDRYSSRDSGEIPHSLVESARRTHAALCESQSSTRLLHGDLHHHNVLFDAERGWIAIDPKGVVGELAYEVGAALRNPCERPELFATPETIARRVDCFATSLQLDPERILGWAFAQAVLAAIWEIEDEGAVRAGKGWIALAYALSKLRNKF